MQISHGIVICVINLLLAIQGGFRVNKYGNNYNLFCKTWTVYFSSINPSSVENKVIVEFIITIVLYTVGSLNDKYFLIFYTKRKPC